MFQMQQSPPSIKDAGSISAKVKVKLKDGLRAMAGNNWIQARDDFYQVLEYAQEFMQCYMNHKYTLTMVQVLVDTGQQFNSLMDFRTAVTCFNCAMCLIIGCESTNPERIMCMCSAFSCLIGTFLFMKDIASAVSVLNQYKGFLLDVELHNVDVKFTLGNILFDVGMAQIENSKFSAAKETLEEAKNHLMKPNGCENSARVAKLLSNLGYCYLCVSSDKASDYLLDAIQLWKKLKYPADECITIINAMKHLLDALLLKKSTTDCSYISDGDICKEMVQLHHIFTTNGLGMYVPDAFTYLGTIAFNRANEAKAGTYFEQALSLYKQAPATDSTRDEICKLLRYIGVSSYNCRQYQRAADSYQECLAMLEVTDSVNASKLSHIAECCAALGFSYSRLRKFDNMLKYYEKALELQSRLVPEDLELIETNIGSLYQVKAVIYEREGSCQLTEKYYILAEKAFTKALRYSWKSFPFVNYGYYLLCRGEYVGAAHTLQQAYLNGVIDKDTVEFDHTEDPILLDDLRTELEGQEDIRMPAPIIALYLKTLAQMKMGNMLGAKNTANQLQQEVVSTKYENYYVIGFGLDRMRALCFSLLGYAYRALGNSVQAYSAFQSAVAIVTDYPAARHNLQQHRSSIVSKMAAS